MPTKVAHISRKGCRACGRCTHVCPQGAIVLGGIVASVNEKKCNGCGICVGVCPSYAIQLAIVNCPVCNRPVNIVEYEFCPYCGEEFGLSSDRSQQRTTSGTEKIAGFSFGVSNGSQQKTTSDASTPAASATDRSQKKNTTDAPKITIQFGNRKSGGQQQSTGNTAMPASEEKPPTPVAAAPTATNCPSCQAALKPGAKFCTKCGKVIEAHTVFDSIHWHDDCGAANYLKWYYGVGGDYHREKPIGAELGKTFQEILKDLDIISSINEIGAVEFEYKGLKFIGGFDDYVYAPDDAGPVFEIYSKGGLKANSGEEFRTGTFISGGVGVMYPTIRIDPYYIEEADCWYFTIHLELKGIYPEYIKSTLQNYLDDSIKALAEFQEDMTKELKTIRCSLAEYIRDFLNTQDGVQASIDAEGTLNFSLDEINYFIFTEKIDDYYCEFFQIFCPNFFETHNLETSLSEFESNIFYRAMGSKVMADSRTKTLSDAARRCSFDIANEIKGVKFTVADDSHLINAYVDGVITSRSEVPIVFPFYFDCLRTGMEEFCKRFDDYKNK